MVDFALMAYVTTMSMALIEDTPLTFAKGSFDCLGIECFNVYAEAVWTVLVVDVSIARMLRG